MNPLRKGFSKLWKCYQDIRLTPGEAAVLFHLHVYKSHKQQTIELQRGQTTPMGAESCHVSYRILAEITSMRPTTLQDHLRRLEDKGLVRRECFPRLGTIIVVLNPEQIAVARTVAGQLGAALTRKKNKEKKFTRSSVRSASGQHVRSGQNRSIQPKKGVFVTKDESSPVSDPVTRSLTTRITSEDVRRVTVFVDKSGVRCGKPSAPQFFVNRAGQAFAVSEETGASWEGQTQAWGFQCVQGGLNHSSLIRDKASADGLKNSYWNADLRLVRQLRVFPQREDFDSRAEWFRAQYAPLNSIGAYRDSLTVRADRINQARALSALVKAHGVFKVSMAIRDVQRNGIGCAWEQPAEGIACYLAHSMPLVLARIERQAYQRERRNLGAARARERRKFQNRSPRVHAFREAFADRRARRLKMDALRARYPKIFSDIPRVSVAELSVCAQLWSV